MKTKKILACILSLAMILTTLSFTAFADEPQSMTFAEFLQTLKSNDYNYDFKGATIKISTDKFCVNPDHSSACPDDYTYVADKESVPARIQGTNAQYQPFNGLDKDITIKNAKFVADVTKGVGLKLKNNPGWEGTIEAGEPVNVELQINNSKSLTIEGCEFDGVNVAPYHNGGSTSSDVEDTFVSNTFKNVYNAYGIQGIRGGKADVKGNTFTNCSGGIYIENGTKGINIANNNFENMGKNCAEEKFDTKGLIQLSASVTLLENADVVITNNTSDGSTPALRQLSSNVKNIAVMGNKFGESSEFTYTTDTLAENNVTGIVPVAKIGDTYYSTFMQAFSKADDGDVIDLIGNTVVLKDVFASKALVIDKDITISNGTFDFTNFGAIDDAVNSTFEVKDGKNVTFSKINFKNDTTAENYTYYSAFGVIYANADANETTVTLNECNFELTHDGRPEGGVLKGNEPGNNSKFIINKCTFNLTDPVRIFANCTIDMTDSSVNATTTGDNLVDNAFRNVYGTISNSNIKAKGFENGIKNTYSIGLSLKDNTTVEISDSAVKDNVQGYDLILKNGANVNVDNTSALVVTTVSKDENENTGINLGDKDGNYNKAGDVFALVFDLNGGTGVSNKMFEKNTNVDLSQYVPSKNGYRFLGWYFDKDLKKAIVNVKMTNNTTIYAKWYETYTPSSSGGVTTTKFTVNFDSNGGSEVESQSVARSTKVKEPTVPTKSGFKFNGWYTDKNCTKKYDFTTRVKADFTLYAGWTVGNVEVQPEVNKNAIVLTIGKTVATVFGEAKTNDVAPIIRNDRTMLPARFVAESLGAKVEWNEELQQVTITKDDVTIVITIGSDKVLVNGEEKTIDSPAFIENDRTYTPIRFICEELGADVDWNETAQTVTITKK